MTNEDLNNAKKGRNDEFYTLYENIEKEMIYYKKHFKDKIIYCNCDDYKTSQFYKYFKDNFTTFKLKKLIATNYEERANTLFHTNIHAIKAETTKEQEIITPLKENGDFRNQENINILKKTDIIITNPPFSLFNEFIGQIIQNKKQYIILGNMNAISYKNVFKHIKENKMWYGVTIKNGDMLFTVPNDYPLTATTTKIINNIKHVRVKGVRWYTNIDHEHPNPQLKLTTKYNEEMHQKYDDYDAINTNKTIDIPNDYYDKIGVPISFMDKYNKNQFEIIDVKTPTLNKKQTYKRIIIKRK